MNQKKINTIKKHLAVKGGHVVTTSLDVANFFSKKHKHVLDAIQSLDVPPEFNGPNFRPVEYRDAKGEMRPMYEVTRKGFVILAMGFTGSKAMRFKIAYIEAFDQMEQALLVGTTTYIPQGNFPSDDRPVAVRHWAGIAYVNHATLMLHLNALHGRGADNTQARAALFGALRKKSAFRKMLTPAERQAEELKQELLRERPMWADIQYLKMLGLNNVQVGRVCRCHPSTVRKHVRKMEALGILTPPGNLKQLQVCAVHLPVTGKGVH